MISHVAVCPDCAVLVSVRRSVRLSDDPQAAPKYVFGIFCPCGRSVSEEESAFSAIDAFERRGGGGKRVE